MPKVLVHKIIHTTEVVDWLTEVYGISHGVAKKLLTKLEKETEEDLYDFVSSNGTPILQDYRMGCYDYALTLYDDQRSEVKTQ